MDLTRPLGRTPAVLLTDTLIIRQGGNINATPPDVSRDLSASGGMVFIRGNSLDVGIGVVTAHGSVARSVNIQPPLSFTNQASAGYVVLQTPNAVTGTTDTPANVIP